MKKKQIMLGLACFAALNVGNYALASDNPFATVPQSTGYYEDVASLVHDGLIDGYKDTDFNTNRPLTRYEMAVFTAKAMSNSQSAGSADTQKIQKLMKEFQSELTDMHVKIPGVKAKSSEKAAKNDKGPKIKALPNNFSLSGLIRYRDDFGGTDYWDGHSDSGQGGTKNHQLLWQMFTGFDIGAGWTGELDFLGAKDANGDKRTTGENTGGYADVNKAFVKGPLFNGKVRFGRVKGSDVVKSSMVMNEYYQGIDYVRDMGKWRTGATWGKIDYQTNSWSGDSNAINSYDTDKSKYYYKNVRGVGDSDLNPTGLGVNMIQWQNKYQATKDLSFDASWWHLTNRSGWVDKYGQTAKTKYADPDIGEIGFNWQATPKFNVLGHVAMSNYRFRDAVENGVAKSDGKSMHNDQNKAYSLTFMWGQIAPAKAHSRRFQLDLVHQERFAGIKSSYDLKNKTGSGQQGFIADYRYVPVTNVMFDFRWMHYRTLGLDTGSASKAGTTNQYRVQIYYYF